MYISFHKNPYSHFTFALLKIFSNHGNSWLWKSNWTWLIQLIGMLVPLLEFQTSLSRYYYPICYYYTLRPKKKFVFGHIWNEFQLPITVGPWLSGLDGINSSYCKGPDNQEPTVTKKIVYIPCLLKFFREVLKILMQCVLKLVGGVRSPSLYAIGLRQLKSQ